MSLMLITGIIINLVSSEKHIPPQHLIYSPAHRRRISVWFWF